MIVYAVFYTFFDVLAESPAKEELVDIFLSYYDASRFVRDHIDYEIKAATNDIDAYWEIEDVDKAEVMQPTCTTGQTSWKYITGYERYNYWGDDIRGHQAYLIYQKTVPIKQLLSK